jgi:flagellar protein FliS
VPAQSNAATSYLSQQILSASPARLVFMLYERAISSLHEAVAAIDAGQIEARWRANKRATEIVTHMWSTLDCERGGEIAANLHRLFAYMLRRMPDIDIKNDRNTATEVIQLLQPLRDAWRDLSNAPIAPMEPPAKAKPMSKPVPAPATPPLMRTSISA